MVTMRPILLLWFAGAFTLAGTAIAVTIIVQDFQAVAANRAALADLEKRVQQCNELVRTPGGLKLREVRRHRNEVIATAGEQALQLHRRRVGSPTNVTPLACKLQIEQSCKNLFRQCTSLGLEVSPDAAAFGFAPILNTGKMPEPAQISPLLQQLELTRELTSILIRTGFDGISAFNCEGVSRNGNTRTIRFHIQCQGPAASAELLLAAMNHANYFFVVRTVELTVPAANRIKAVVDVDYVELQTDIPELSDVR